jgi:quinol monooxygenase YgiN
MILVAGTVRVAEGGLDKAADAMRTVLEATRQEDGCIRYAYARDVLDPDLMHVSELWRDAEALRAHAAAPHMKSWGAAMREAGVIERDLRMYEVGKGTPL